MKLIKEAVTGWFGERCQEALEGCQCCDAWAEYDTLTRLAEAVEALGAMPEGYCFCGKDRIGDDSKTHEPECRDLRAALAAAKAVQHG